ncbi:MAG: acyl-CoA thioesterase [Ignavibacteria bacterium]|nr:acyl-CoA thioesterase [Ignavibacteria bacterium]
MDGFKHSMNVTVRFNEVDMLGVCNNAVYISYFEEARIKYIKHLGLLPPGGIFSDGSLFFMVRNEINYRGHAYYDEELIVYNRVSFIKNSSYGFDHVVVKASTGESIVDGSGIIVRVDPVTRKSTPLDEEFIRAIVEYEPDVQIMRDK